MGPKRRRRRHPAQIERRIAGAASAIGCAGMIVAIQASYAVDRPVINPADPTGDAVAAARADTSAGEVPFNIAGAAAGAKSDRDFLAAPGEPAMFDAAVLADGLFSEALATPTTVAPTTQPVPPPPTRAPATTKLAQPSPTRPATTAPIAPVASTTAPTTSAAPPTAPTTTAAATTTTQPTTTRVPTTTRAPTTTSSGGS